MENIPDGWVLIRYYIDNECHTRVFSTWGGSYLNGASWSLNSGIEKVNFIDGSFEVSGASGTKYYLRKDCYGVRGTGNDGVLKMIVSKIAGTDILSEEESVSYLTDILNGSCIDV